MNKIKLSLFCLCLFTAAFSYNAHAANWWDVGYSQGGTVQSSTQSQVIIPETNIATNPGTSNNSNINSTTNISTVPLKITSYNVEGDANGNNIRDEVDGIISSLVSQYNFDLKQKRSLEQIARSYQYVLIFVPNNVSSAFQVNIRDVAATKCAEQRLPASTLDLVVEKIEAATLNTTQKRAVYEAYTNLLDENNQGVSSNSSCEDEFSGSGANPNNGGPITSSEQSLPCLVLNQFMEIGSSGQQVIKLQTFLVLSGNMSVWPTGYFGGNTAFAVKNFQNKYGIDSSRSWVGPSTRAKVAEITCNGDSVAIANAKNGFSVKKYVAPKKVAYKKPAVKTVSETTTIEIATTTIETSTIFVDNTSLATLSNTSGTFDTKRNPINALYFTVKADTKRDELYVCTESKLNSNCFDQSSYTLVRQKYDSATYDSIASNDRWIFNIYYNQNIWGSTGGKIYFKNGTGGVASVYSVSVR